MTASLLGVLAEVTCLHGVMSSVGGTSRQEALEQDALSMAALQHLVWKTLRS